jgi:hypothetical protein
MRFFTTTITSAGGNITLIPSDGVQFLSILCSSSSSCTVTGDLTFRGVTQSSAVTLTDNQGLNLSSPPTSSVYGITIAWVSGSIDVVMGF